MNKSFHKTQKKKYKVYVQKIVFRTVAKIKKQNSIY